ncbi:MAG: peptidoglycan recognition protein family protein [Candidatus Obscuribacterales bacterium]|nr:peptidoglycan recognition protein family protein [Candidatus Obscuribacterales bacterium]
MNKILSTALAVSLFTAISCLPISSSSIAAKVTTPTTKSTPKQNRAGNAGKKLSPREKTCRAFAAGNAANLSPMELLAAKVFTECPLIGGTYERKEPVKYVVLHSTETATTADAKRVIRSWNNRGKSHPGAQYVVDRDGTIYQTVSPEIATMHVNAFKTRYGVSNRNSIGIEIVRSGKQKYTPKQLQNVSRLCLYLQQRFGIEDDHVVSHSYVQPSDRSDPVNFNWKAFNISKNMLALNAKQQLGNTLTAVAEAEERP